MRRALGVLLGSVLLAACPPTLSRPDSPEHLDELAAGDRHAHHGRLDQAATEYARAAEQALRRVDRDEARYRRSRVLRRAGRAQEAQAELEVLALQEPPSRRTPRAIYDLAIVLGELGDAEGSARAYERVVREFGEDGLGPRALRAWLTPLPAERLEPRLAALYDELREGVLGDNILSWRVELAEARGDREQARALLEQIVTDHPYPQGHRWDEATMQLAKMDLEDEHPRRALERLETMLERSEGTSPPGSYTLPTFPKAQLMIARIHRDYLDDRDAAATAFERVVDDFEHSILRDDAMLEEGEMWIEAGERDRGCALLREVVEEFEVGRSRRRAQELLTTACDG